MVLVAVVLPDFVIAALLISVSLKFNLKLSRGSSRKSVPRLMRSARFCSQAAATIASSRAMIASIDSFNWSIKNCSDIFFTHTRS